MILKPNHPGEVCLEEYFEKDLFHPRLVQLIASSGKSAWFWRSFLNGLTPVTKSIDSELQEAFGTSEGFWMRMQEQYNTRYKKFIQEQNLLFADLKITNLRFGDPDKGRGETVYAELRDGKDRLLISATLAYILDALEDQERNWEAV